MKKIIIITIVTFMILAVIACESAAVIDNTEMTESPAMSTEPSEATQALQSLKDEDLDSLAGTAATVLPVTTETPLSEATESPEPSPEKTKATAKPEATPKPNKTSQPTPAPTKKPKWSITVEGGKVDSVTDVDFKSLPQSTVTKERVNSVGTVSILKCKGVKTKSLMGLIASGSVSSITVVAEDGYSKTFKTSEILLFATYRERSYPDDPSRDDKGLGSDGPVLIVPKSDSADMYVKKVSKLILE